MTASSWSEIENKWKDRKRKLDMEMSAVMRKIASKKILGTKAPRLNDDALHLVLLEKIGPKNSGGRDQFQRFNNKA